MLLKLLLKLWPSYIPLALYFLWLIVERITSSKSGGKGDEYKVVGENKKKGSSKSIWSDNRFIIALTASMATAIVMFLLFALESINDRGGDKYVPAQYRDGKITPARKK